MKLNERLNDLRTRLAAVEAERDTAQAGEARAVEALRDVCVDLQADLKDRNPEDYARHGLVEPGYCEALQDVTDGLEAVLDSLSQPALAWLAQREREAAAKALEKAALKGWTTPFSLREDAAALRAGKEGEE